MLNISSCWYTLRMNTQRLKKMPAKVMEQAYSVTRMLFWPKMAWCGVTKFCSENIIFYFPQEYVKLVSAKAPKSRVEIYHRVDIMMENSGMENVPKVGLLTRRGSICWKQFPAFVLFAGLEKWL